MRHRFTAGMMAAAMGIGLLATGVPQAQASSKGRKNTALGLGAAAAYELLRGKTGTGLLAGVGAAYAYKRYRDAQKDERRYGRYNRTRYRTSSDDGSRFPSDYSGNNDYRYRNDGYSGDDGYRSRRGSYQDDNRQYGYRETGSYTTDEWGNRHYYDPRYGDGTRRSGYSDSYQSTGYSSDGRPCPPRRSRNR
jgi:hypothetical protein